MAWMVYSFINKDGEEHRNDGLYESVEQLDQTLFDRDEEIINVYALPEFFYHIRAFFIPKLKDKEVAEFATMLAMYIAGGIDLHYALEDMATSSGTTPAFKRVATTLKKLLIEGYPLSEAMERTRQFPEEMLSLCKIGEDSGHLDQVLRESAIHIERVIEIKSSSKRALIYPGFTLSVILLGSYFWLAFVIPKVAKVFESINAKLPESTMSLIEASKWAEEYWWLFLLIFISTPAVFMFFRRNEKFRYHTDRMAWYSPVFGAIVQGTQMTFYFQYLALLYRAGVPITQAIHTLTYAMSNRFMRTHVLSVIEELRNGDSLVSALNKTKLYDPLAIRMIGVGEETGNLDGQLEKLGEIYFNKVNKLVDVLSKTMEPFLVIIMGLIFGFFLIAIIGPIYETIGNIGNLQ